MDKYVCDMCGYIYDPAEGDPDNGVAPGTPWEKVPEDWVCPLCGVGKDQFSKEKPPAPNGRPGVRPAGAPFWRWPIRPCRSREGFRGWRSCIA